MDKPRKNNLARFIKTPVGLLITLFLGLLLSFVIVIKLMSGSDVSQSAKKMQTQKEEAVQGNVRYTTQETLNTLTGEADNLTKSVGDLKMQFKQVKSDSVKARLANAVRVEKEIKALQQENSSLKNTVVQAISQIKSQKKSAQNNTNNSDDYNIGDGQTLIPKTKSDFVWIQDNNALSQNMTGKITSGHFDVEAVSTNDTGDLLHPSTDRSQRHITQSSYANSPSKSHIIPMYTIPENSWLTGVIAEQPLIGIVPVNGEVINPRTLSFAVQAKNLAANNWRLPEVLKGIQGDAVCQGFFAIKRPAVTCNVTSLTFIFQDGRIDTVNVPRDAKLGVVTDLYGNPQISGRLHSNLGYFLTGTTLFAGAKGYGNALSAAQVQTQTGSGLVPNIATIIGSANTYAEGQGLSAAAQAAQEWWVQRMKSTFDYVEVPNWNPKTHQLLQLNVKITHPIALDYNTKARKVIYEHQIHASYNNSLD